MPLYEYYCQNCRKKFEALRPMSKADAPIACEYCAGKRTARQLSRFAAHSRDASGGSQAIAGGGGGGCASCSGGSCASCGVR